MSIGKWLDSRGFDVKTNGNATLAARSTQLVAAAAAAAAIPAGPTAALPSMLPPVALPAPARHKASKDRDRDYAREDPALREPAPPRERKGRDRDDTGEAWEPWLDTIKGNFRPIQARSPSVSRSRQLTCSEEPATSLLLGQQPLGSVGQRPMGPKYSLSAVVCAD